MNERIHYLVAISGAEDPGLVGFVARMLRPDAADLELAVLHVIETEARGLAATDPALRHALWPRQVHRVTEQDMDQADEGRASALLASWSDRLRAALPGAAVTTVVRRGRAERAIIAAAEELHPAAIVVCSRAGTGPAEPGPRSVGHVARFVLDHSPVPVVLVRGRL
jgi:nucleotide-binding universal stress UspA family protein